MKFIDKLRKMADETMEAAQWPFRKRAIYRAFDSAIDGAESKRISVETAILDKQRELTKCKDEESAKRIVGQIVTLRLELRAAEDIAAVAKAEKDKLDEDVEE